MGNIRLTSILLGTVIVISAVAGGAAAADDWPDTEFKNVTYGEHNGTISSEDDADQFRIPVRTGHVVNLSLASDTLSQVTVDIEYPSGEYEHLDAENPSERITIEEDGYIYVEVQGYASDFEEFPYSWTVTANKEPNSDDWKDNEHAAVEFGTYTGDINTPDDTDELRFQAEAGDVINLSLTSDTLSQVTVDIEYPSGEYEHLDAENPSEQITVEERGYIYVELDGYTSDFEEFPYSWALFVGPPELESSGPTANANISPTNTTVGDTISFDATGSTAPAGTSITAYEWDFTNDGITDATGATVTHEYGTSGTYEASLTVTDDTGATDTVTKSVTITEPSGDGATVALTPDSVSVLAGGTNTVNISITNTGDIAAYEFELKVTGSSSVQIADVTPHGDPGVQNVTIASDGQSASVNAATANVDGTSEAIIASVKLTGSDAGDATLKTTVKNIGDLAGDGYSISDGSATAAVSVQAGPGDVTDNGNAATDPDGDGKYEDVNGDGSVNVLDVQALFWNLDSDKVSGNAALDLNDDGDTNILDVQALFADL